MVTRSKINQNPTVELVDRPEWLSMRICCNNEGQPLAVAKKNPGKILGEILWSSFHPAGYLESRSRRPRVRAERKINHHPAAYSFNPDQSTNATTRAGAALALSSFIGKNETLKPCDGNCSRLASCCTTYSSTSLQAKWASQIFDLSPLF